MAAIYTFDVFTSLDGFGGVTSSDWGGYWGKQGPELLEHRLAAYEPAQRIVLEESIEAVRLSEQRRARVDPVVFTAQRLCYEEGCIDPGFAA